MLFVVYNCKWLLRTQANRANSATKQRYSYSLINDAGTTRARADNDQIYSGNDRMGPILRVTGATKAKCKT